MDEEVDKGLAPRLQTDEIARGALAPGSEEQRRAMLAGEWDFSKVAITPENRHAEAWPDAAHSKSEYKRRVAQGDPSVLPPEPCTFPDCACPVVGGLPQCRGAAAACGVPLPAPADAPSPRNAMQLALSALRTAVAGLEWYRDRCPDAVDGSDGEADDEIGAAIAALDDALAAGVLGTATPQDQAIYDSMADRYQRERTSGVKALHDNHPAVTVQDQHEFAGARVLPAGAHFTDDAGNLYDENAEPLPAGVKEDGRG